MENNYNTKIILPLNYEVIYNLTQLSVIKSSTPLTKL